MWPALLKAFECIFYATATTVLLLLAVHPATLARHLFKIYFEEKEKFFNRLSLRPPELTDLEEEDEISNPKLN